MPKFTYLGLSDEQKKSRLEAQMSKLDPPEKTAQEPYYHISSHDHEDVKEEKRKRIKKWMDARKKELVVDIDELDEKTSFKDPYDLKGKKKIVFKKGEPVEIPRDHPLFDRLKGYSIGNEKFGSRIKNTAFLMGEPKEKTEKPVDMKTVAPMRK